jgi:hypothetical protein
MPSPNIAPTANAAAPSDETTLTHSDLLQTKTRPGLDHPADLTHHPPIL